MIAILVSTPKTQTLVQKDICTPMFIVALSTGMFIIEISKY